MSSDSEEADESQLSQPNTKKHHTQEQFDVLISTIGKNPIDFNIGRGSRMGPILTAKNAKAWQELTDALNAVPNGAKKTETQWRTSWHSMRGRAWRHQRDCEKLGVPVNKGSIHYRILNVISKKPKRTTRTTSDCSADVTNSAISQPISSAPDQDPLLTTTLQDSLKRSPCSLDCSRHSSPVREDALPRPEEADKFDHPPSEPYTLREMQFYYLLKSAREDVRRLTEERNFFKTEFVLMREMMQETVKFLNKN